MLAKNSGNERFEKEIDDVSIAVGALCELLAAAQHGTISAASLHALLQPISHRLDIAAGAIADSYATSHETKKPRR